MRFTKYLLTRILIWVLTLWVGVTVVFILQRMLPSDPIETMIGKMTSLGTRLTEEEISSIRAVLARQYGLEGSFLEQYGAALKRVVTLDFGPSLTMFPTPVMYLIRGQLPYTVGLLLFTTLAAWVIGNGIGLIAGFNRAKWYSKGMETISMCIYPIPYFIMALVLVIFCCHINNWFPLMATVPPGFSLSFDWIRKMVHNAFLPAFSLIVLSSGWWVISMKSLASNVAQEDFVRYGRLKGLRQGTIAYRYVFRNCILTQTTALALALGGLFSGSMMTEIMFGFPGVGMLLQSSITQADYNLMLGLITISIIAVSTATLLIDLLYPLLDPRIRYS